MYHSAANDKAGMRKDFLYPLAFALLTACNTDEKQVADKPTMFRMLDADQTGIDFSNSLEYTEELNPYVFRNFYNGGGVGIGYSLHAGQVIVADGEPGTAERLNRVLTNDPGIGVVRHADAGYEEAQRFAEGHGIQLPSHPSSA